MQSILINRNIINGKYYVYDLSSNKIVFNGPTRTVNLKMCKDVKNEYKDKEECDISELPKYLYTNKNIIGLICSCHMKYNNLINNNENNENENVCVSSTKNININDNIRPPADDVGAQYSKNKIYNYISNN